MLFLSIACSAQNEISPSYDLTEHSALEHGPFSIGYKTLTHPLVDPINGTTLDIPFNIWYPSTSELGSSANYFNILQDEEVFEDVLLAENERPFPLMVFSHGSFLYGASSAFLPKHFASHGWVVIAPDHLNHTMSDYSTTVNIAVHYHRPFTNSIAIDVIDAMVEWSERVSTETVVLSGFSFGGYDSWTSVGTKLSRQGFIDSCQSGSLNGDCSAEQFSLLESGFEDSRFHSIIPMAGSSQFDKLLDNPRDNLNVVAFQISGSKDSDSPEEVFENTNGTPLYWLDITGGCHALFSVGGCSEIETALGHQIIQSYALAFARFQILEDRTEEVVNLLSGEIAPWAQTTLLKK
jgi:hypothetical protein